jgi:hypothetical protein
MKNLVLHRSKTRFLAALAVLAFAGNLALILKVMEAASFAVASVLQTESPYPTDYPPDWQTQEHVQRQTQRAAALMPIPTGSPKWSIPIITSTLIPGPTETYPATPAGDGAIIDSVGGGPLDKLMGVTTVNAWFANISGEDITVYAGSAYEDDTQGVIYVATYGHRLPSDSYFKTPGRTGAVRIVGAQGQRLILRSTGGDTYYFDVPSLQFVNSLTAIVPSVTPRPVTLTPTMTPTLNADAPHNPDNVPGLSPVNTPLHYILSRAGDEHWFRFRLATPGTFQVRLDNLPANYDLYVYSGSQIGYGGKSTNPGTTTEVVIINNAPVDDYLVSIVSVNGAFDPTHPYQLAFVVSTASFMPTLLRQTAQPTTP